MDSLSSFFISRLTNFFPSSFFLDSIFFVSSLLMAEPGTFRVSLRNTPTAIFPWKTSLSTKLVPSYGSSTVVKPTTSFKSRRLLASKTYSASPSRKSCWEILDSWTQWNRVTFIRFLNMSPSYIAWGPKPPLQSPSTQACRRLQLQDRQPHRTCPSYPYRRCDRRQDVHHLRRKQRPGGSRRHRWP